MRIIDISLVLAALAAADASAAQSYPTRPVRMVVPFVAGGATDIVARALGQRMAGTLGKPVVVDNRGGAGGIIGTDLAAKAPADGYTLLMATAANAANASLVRNLPHDFQKDLAPITLVVMSPYLLVVHPSVPAKSTAELIAALKRSPGTFNYASSGNGSSQHLVGVLFGLMSGTQMVHIPYKGAGGAFADLLAGQVQTFFSAIPGALPYVKAGRLRALAVTSNKRAAGLPDIPTIDESGLPGFDMSGWYGMLAPAATPAPIVRKLAATASGALQSAETRDLLVGMGLEPIGSSPQDFAKFIGVELRKYAELTRAANLRPE